MTMFAQRCSIARISRSAVAGGGYSEAYAAPHATDRPCKLSQPSAAEIRQADALNQQFVTAIHFPAVSEDVQGQDQITITASPVARHVGQVYDVLHVVPPSSAGRLRADCQLIVGR